MYKIDKLLKLNRDLYHTGDLGVLWEITNKNTLYTTIKRYVQKGILIPIHKGLYATKPLDKIASTGEISRFMLALKSALAEADTIPVLIFDEIDIGVGGRSGEGIGRKLAPVVLFSRPGHEVKGCFAFVVPGVYVCPFGQKELQEIFVTSRNVQGRITCFVPGIDIGSFGEE